MRDTRRVGKLMSSIHQRTVPKLAEANMKLPVLLSFIAILAGCATTSTGAISAGPDTFVVSRQAGALPSGREPLLAEAIGEATATCAAMKKTLKVLSTAENPGPYIFGNYPKATVVFSCL